MRALTCSWVVCLSVACTGIALAAPGAGARAKLRQATKANASGNLQQALAIIEEGLATAPKDLELLSLKGTVLLELRDHAGALAVYEAYLAAGARGENRDKAQMIVGRLKVVRTTSLDITLANGPAAIYLGSKAEGELCTAAPSCTRPMMPDTYKVIAERSGFERWTGSVTVVANTTTRLAITLVEKPSLLTVRAEPPGARVTVDGTAYDAPAKVAAGPHHVVVSLAGHAEAQREVEAHAGAPVEVDVALVPRVPVRVTPGVAQLWLDDKPVAVADGGLDIPPGAHTLAARAQGFVDRRIAIPVVRPPDYQLVVELEASRARPVTSDHDRASVSRPRKLASIAVAAGGGLAIGAGLVFGAKAQSTHGDAVALCGSDLVCDSPADFDRGHRLVGEARSQAAMATVLVAIGGAAVVAGGILWLTAPRERHAQAARLVPVVGGSHVGLTVAGGF